MTFRALAPAGWLVVLVAAFAAYLVLRSGTAGESISSAAGQRPTSALSRAMLRRPVAAAFLNDATAAVVNARSGTVSVVDVDSGRVLGESPVAPELSGLALLPDGDVLTVNPGGDELLALRREGAACRVVARAATSRSPASVVASPQGTTVAVACLWSRRIDVFTRTSGERRAAPSLTRAASVELGFSPQLLLWLPGGAHVLAADAFGGRLAVVDPVAARVVATHSLSAHNIRGLALSPDGTDVFASHQILDEHAQIDWRTVHSGTLMANVARRLPVSALSDPKADLEGESRLIEVGMTGHGSGDPAGILARPNGELAVCSAGASEVVVINRHEVLTHRLLVGTRPTAIVPGPGDLALVVSTFDDSVSVVSLDEGTLLRTIRLGPQPELTAADRGELAFHDARLSHDSWLSCHSCHSDGHTNGLRSDTFGDRNWGAPKRVLTLRGVVHTHRWGWLGAEDDLAAQVKKSFFTSMLSDGLGDATVHDVLAYIESLPPPPPLAPAATESDRRRIERGRTVFLDRGCQSCHIPPLTYTTSDAFDVGLEDEHGATRFNPPSLRGAGHGPRYLHDNRAATLESVFRDHAHPGDTLLSDEELADLVRFLQSL